MITNPPQIKEPHSLPRSTKSVSFHPVPTFSPQTAGASQKTSNFSELVWESRESNSGYTAQDGGNVHNEGARQSYSARLVKFYEKYNPEKLPRVEEYLHHYRGKEEQLFAILISKYGAEPSDDLALKSTNSILSSEADSVMHYAGKRHCFPKKVSPEEGNTDCETPYWAGGSSLVSDRDLLSLLQYLETENSELQKCFMGLFAQHPTDCWNGMVYITRADGIAPANTQFLGHTWVGTLGSGKVVVHECRKYHRTTLYCTDECQRHGDHERWRLSVYNGERNSLFLLRTVWDPVVVPEPMPLSRSNISERELHSSFEALPTRLSSMSSDYSSSCGFEQPLQPQQQPWVAAIAQFTKQLQDFEERVMERFENVESRIERLESLQ